MKKTSTLVAGALAGTAALATLITNGKTIVKGVVTLYHLATGGGQSSKPSKLTPLERIKRGESFHILFRHTFGDFAAGQTYFARYNPSLSQMVVAGFAATINKPNATNGYPCPDIDEGRIILWGRQFFVKDDEIVDSETKRPSGKIQFDSDGQ
jgi:hypothetical protein